jgi:hypothetical protein
MHVRVFESLLEMVSFEFLFGMEPNATCDLNADSSLFYN